MRNVPIKLSALALMASSVLCYPALAQTADDTKPPASSGATPTGGEKTKDLRQFSQAGHSAMVNIGDARLAIFNGDPKSAMKLMESAKTFLAQADKESPATKMRSVPVDGQLALADDFVMTPEK
jgi:hypothetical protein